MYILVMWAKGIIPTAINAICCWSSDTAFQSEPIRSEKADVHNAEAPLTGWVFSVSHRERRDREPASEALELRVFEDCGSQSLMMRLAFSGQTRLRICSQKVAL